MNKRRDALRRGVRALILDTSRELANLEGRQRAPESAAPGSPAETPVPPLAPPADGGAAEKGVRASEPVRPSGPPGGAVPGGETRPEDTRRLSEGIRADEARAERSSPVPSVETPPHSVVAEAHVEGPPGRAPQAPVPAAHASPMVSTIVSTAPTAPGAAHGTPPPPWASPPEGRSSARVLPARRPAAVDIRARPPEQDTPAQRLKPGRPARDGQAARDGQSPKAAHPPKAGPPPKAAPAHPRRRPASPSPVRKMRRSRRRALPDIPVDGVDPQQAFSRTGVCFAYFINNKCWRIRDAYCNTALHMCLIRNCPVYHLHRDALERRFAQKFQHFW